MQDISRFTILLVDDDPEQREYLATKFKQFCECEIFHAETPAVALALLRKNAMSVVVSDFLMPEGTETGVDLLRLASQTQTAKPILVLTTGFEDLLPDDAFKREITAVFRKPFSADELINTVLKHVRPELLALIKRKT
jgi:CheY-like chemotaxis protein